MRVTTFRSFLLRQVGLAAVFALVSSSAWAATPSVAGMTIDACGSWKNKMRNYGGYKIENFNDLVPPNLAVDESEEIPGSTWEFMDDGTTRGFAFDDAFIGILDIVDETGASRPQVIGGEYEQKKKKLKLQIDNELPDDSFANASSVLLATDTFITTFPTEFHDNYGPVRFRAGALPDDESAVLPRPINETTDYYVNWLSSTFISVSLEPGGPAVDLTTQGTGRHTIYAAGTTLANSFTLLSELFLFGDREVVGVLEFVSTSKIKAKAKLGKNAQSLKIKLSGKTNYDIDTDDVEGLDFDGKFGYKASTAACPAPPLLP